MLYVRLRGELGSVVEWRNEELDVLLLSSRVCMACVVNQAKELIEYDSGVMVLRIQHETSIMLFTIDVPRYFASMTSST
jgi:hypothetical protein